MRTMWSVKIRPNPGSASSRSLCSGATAWVVLVTANSRVDVLVLISERVTGHPAIYDHPCRWTAARFDRPPPISACLFDLDGVLTQTARVHAVAWKTTFDGFLKQRAERKGEWFK